MSIYFEVMNKKKRNLYLIKILLVVVCAFGSPKIFFLSEKLWVCVSSKELNVFIGGKSIISNIFTFSKVFVCNNLWALLDLIIPIVFDHLILLRELFLHKSKSKGAIVLISFLVILP